jgi:hypothetical protein
MQSVRFARLALAFVLAAAGCSAKATGADLKPPPIHIGGCPAGQMSCSGHCINTLTDFHNCGACGNACVIGQVCTGGKCGTGNSCTATQTLCGTACVDTQTDAKNCGACDTACAAGETCQAGACVGGTPMCGQGETLCSNACTDTTTDNSNCGACGTVCPAGQNCMASVCTMGGPMCGTGQTSCNGQCTTLSGDANNCGACGNVCMANQKCTAGQCVTSMTMGGTAGCADTLACGSMCATQVCVQMCLANASTMGRMLLDALLSCLKMACPNTNGGVCDRNSTKFSQSACSSCIQMANTGACGQAAQACQADTGTGGMMGCLPGQTMCGNTCTDLTSDAANCGACGNACPMGQTCNFGQCGGGGGTMTGCAGTLDCIANVCAPTDVQCQMTCLNNATQQGQQLLFALIQCVDMACPSSPGGVCDPAGSQAACDACFNTSQGPGGPCESAFNSCVNNP